MLASNLDKMLSVKYPLMISRRESLNRNWGFQRLLSRLSVPCSAGILQINWHSSLASSINLGSTTLSNGYRLLRNGPRTECHPDLETPFRSIYMFFSSAAFWLPTCFLSLELHGVSIIYFFQQYSLSEYFTTRTFFFNFVLGSMPTPEEIQLMLNAPAGRPPAGVTPDFDSPPTLFNYLILLAVLCAFVTILVVPMRFYTKLFLIRSVAYEDCKVFRICSFH